ncbi:ATP synthase subunit a [Polymorphobacter glacialis]|uniref:ATP synthase subunit a n=1 Tax=Sandarakinorhabdus glacialis TaxID=1614636 RepID=A0A917E3H7_9SPHN|nr:F0F1 ATP synthase subunit A [Polymorphobacter glacialis]GGE01405.1 ATP synthase subunit a [Polymorphobacter glacialis]
MANPMEQFAIERIGPPIVVAGNDFSFTNSSLWMLIAMLAVAAFLYIGTARPQLVPGRAQAAVEYVYEFIRDMLRENVGKEGLKYAPLIFALFVFVLSCNLLGLIPFVGAFTPTSHIAVTFGLAIIVFALVLIVGFAKHGLHFFKLFLPEGTPIFVLPLVAAIEFLSFLSRPFTLAIRLFANMTAGHVLLKVFGGFVVALGSFEALPYVFGIIPLGVNVALTALELLIAVVQAYVFALLASIYLNDAVNLH